MQVTVQFFSYLKDATGCSRISETLAAGSTVADLCQQLYGRFPRLEPLRKSTFIAVGVDYRTPEHPLRDGDEVSFFPPVQGG